ncbi:MAG: DUF6252 family protein [Bacteroidales bacterium]
MKKHFILLATSLLLGLSISFYACDDDDDDNGDDVAATCNDGIQNQGEEGIDCGGPCLLCQSMSAKIDGNTWEADQLTIQGLLLGSDIYIQGSRKDGSSNIQLVYKGIWNTGTYELKSAKYKVQGHEYVLVDPADASITFTSFTVDAPNYQDSTMTGTFTATLHDTLANPVLSVDITDGSFTDIYFNN